MKNTHYTHCKNLLIEDAKEAKRTTNGKDKPYIRQVINDCLGGYLRQLDFDLLQGRISEKQFDLYCLWLENLACKLHPKK